MRAPWSVVLLCVLAAACGRGNGKAAADPVPDRSAFVVRGSEMSGNVLDGLRSRVPGMSVVRQSGTCPGIIFRGQRSAQFQGNPSIYIDEVLMGDTCILTQVPSSDVVYVEIYTGGTSGKSGFQRNPFGSIFVYRIRS
ncbi:hypothetical protein BH23GEM9_BH23GEM9_34310 [soil metagenome]